jgi:hypothetical protein
MDSYHGFQLLLFEKVYLCLSHLVVIDYHC